MNLRRTFLSPDGTRLVGVQVTITPSPIEAQKALDARLNQLVRYNGWIFGTVSGLGERAYGGSGAADDGQIGQTLVFRVNAIAAEVTLIGPGDRHGARKPGGAGGGGADDADADAVLNAPAFATPTPRSFPGMEPPGPPADLIGGVSGGVGNAAGGPALAIPLSCSRCSESSGRGWGRVGRRRRTGLTT